jgi:hypothetical protein
MGKSHGFPTVVALPAQEIIDSAGYVRATGQLGIPHEIHGKIVGKSWEHPAE